MKRILLHLAASILALATTARSDGLPAQVSIRGSKGKDVTVIARQRNTLSLQLPEHRLGTVKVDVADIHNIQFALPSVAQKALALYQQNKWDGCADLLKPIILPYLDYVDLPNNNALPLVEKYAESLRQSRRYAEAAEVYQRLQNQTAPKLRQRAMVSLAYCEVARGLPNEAKALLRGAAVTNHHEEVFGLARLVEARIGLHETNALAGIDAAAQAIAALPIDSPYYAESLIVSATCYERLHHEKAAGSLADANREEAAYEDRKPTLPAALTNLIAVARAINQQVTNMFPETLWAADAQRKLTELDATNQPVAAVSAPDAAPDTAGDKSPSDPMQEELP